MRLSDRDRKLLWGRAGNRCTLCRTELVVPASESDRPSIIGDEAHIVADSPTGPRGDSVDRSQLDTYENAILLCKVDHKRVDDQPNTYTSEVLRSKKAEHEEWVRTRLSAAERTVAENVAGEVTERRHAEDYEGQELLRRFGPSNWCAYPYANGPEAILRCAVALPGPVKLGQAVESQAQITRLRSDAREDLIASVLEASQLTESIRALQPGWHWVTDDGWSVLGGAGNVELTRLELDLVWPGYRIRQSLGVACSVLTGLADSASESGHRPGLVIAIDIALNVVELDGERQPSHVAYRTTPPPAPAALTLSEFASMLRLLLDTPDIALDLASALLPEARPEGHVAMWLMLNGVELERVIHLDNLERLRGGSMVTRWERSTPWLTGDESAAPTWTRTFVEGFIEGLLEQSDYRRYMSELADAVNAAENARPPRTPP